jgi:hypothetical protein
VRELLVVIQHELFNLGGELSIPGFELLKADAVLRLDEALGHYNAQLPRLQEFILQQQFVNVLTGGQSGVYYPMGVALSQIFAKDIPNVRSTAQVTKASAENLNLLQAGRGELA